MRTGRSYSSTKGSSRVRIPLWLSSNSFHVVSASVASAVVMATPVTTTLGSVFPVTSFACDNIKCDLGIGCLVIQCGRNDAVSQRQHRECRLERTDRTNGVAQR